MASSIALIETTTGGMHAEDLDVHIPMTMQARGRRRPMAAEILDLPNCLITFLVAKAAMPTRREALAY